MGFKRTVVAEFNRLQPGRGRLSRDRLARIRMSAQNAAREDVVASKRGASQEALDEADQGGIADTLGVGDDFAMAFLDKGKYSFWIGRVHVLKRKRSKGPAVLLTERVSLTTLPKDVLVSAIWYYVVRADRQDSHTVQF